jgi:ADP-ribose pyrophosphatase YjhB (NUDIX family)
VPRVAGQPWRGLLGPARRRPRLPESPEAGVVREVEEETGLVAEITGPPVIHSDTGVWERRSGSLRFHHVRFVYPMRVVGGEERLEVDGSTDAFEWVATDAVGDRLLGDLVGRALSKSERGD